MFDSAFGSSSVSSCIGSPSTAPSHFVTSLDTDDVLSIDPADCRNASTIRLLFDGTSNREVERVMASGMDRRVILEALASQGIPCAVASDLPPLPEAAAALLLYGSRARGDALPGSARSDTKT